MDGRGGYLLTMLKSDLFLFGLVAHFARVSDHFN